MKIVLIDHHDSFAWNLAHLFGAASGELPEVVQSEALEVARLLEERPELVVLGPGPGHPADPRAAGRSLTAIAALRGRIPLFGVCFGLQLLVVAGGGRVVRAAAPMHGKRSRLRHAGTGLFAGLPPGIAMMRYHSLVAEPATLPPEFKVVATTATGEVMAIEASTARASAVQFHPESIGSTGGERLAANVVEWARRGDWPPS